MDIYSIFILIMFISMLFYDHYTYNEHLNQYKNIFFILIAQKAIISFILRLFLCYIFIKVIVLCIKSL